MNPPNRQHRAVTFNQAVENSPSLARLAELVRESNDRLKAVESLIPEGLRSSVKAGPIDGENWCLLVTGNAAAAKVRQVIPLIQTRLLHEGCQVSSIRLKILLTQK